MASIGPVLARRAVLLGASLLVAGSLAATTPVSAATVTRHASCAGYAFHPRDAGTVSRYAPAISEVWSSGPDSTHVLVCDPQLPQGAVVTGVRFTVADRSASAQVDGCGLYRTDLLATANPAAQELAATAATGIGATPGIAVLVDTTIARATIDNTRYAYWLTCRPGGNAEQAGLPDTGLRGATVSFKVSTTPPSTRAVSCAGATFVERAGSRERSFDIDTSEVRAFATDERTFACNVTLPQGAVVRSARFTLADRTATGAATGCGLFRADLRTTVPGSPVTMASVPSTGVAAITGIVRLADTTIANATVDNSRYGYWVSCRLDADGVTQDDDPEVGLRGVAITFSGGTTVTGAIGCVSPAFHPVDGGVDKQFDASLTEAAADGGDGFLVCNPGLPHGMTISKLQATIADRGAGMVRYCGLYQADLRASSTGEAIEVALLAPTSDGGAPGRLRPADSTIDRTTVNRQRFGYWLQCQTTNAGRTPEQQLLTALRGMTLTSR